jgi:hypothetical protein
MRPVGYMAKRYTLAFAPLTVYLLAIPLKNRNLKKSIVTGFLV